MTVTPEQIEVRKAVGRFVRTQFYEAPLVPDLSRPGPDDEDEQPRKDFCLEFMYHEKTCASAREWANGRPSTSLRSCRRGSNRGGRGGERRGGRAVRASTRSRRSWYCRDRDGAASCTWRLSALVLAAIASLVVVGNRHADKPQAPQPPTRDASGHQPAWPRDRGSVRQQARLRIGDDVFCASRPARTPSWRTRVSPAPTWSRWTCVVTARSTTPPLRRAHASLSLLRHASAGRKFYRPGVLCGPDPAPPIGS